jgi:hypothetical protein
MPWILKYVKYVTYLRIVGVILAQGGYTEGAVFVRVQVVSKELPKRTH